MEKVSTLDSKAAERGSPMEMSFEYCLRFTTPQPTSFVQEQLRELKQCLPKLFDVIEKPLTSPVHLETKGHAPEDTKDSSTDQKLGVQSFDKLDARTHDKHSSRQTSTAVKIEPGTQGRGGKAFFAQSSNFREGDVKLDSSTKELTLDSMGKKSIQSLQRAPVRADIAETLSSRPSHQDPYILTALGDDLDAMSTSPHRHPCPMAEKAFCSATFATRQVADRHAKSAHTTKKEYFCEHCPKAFTRKDHLKQHQRTHASKA